MVGTSTNRTRQANSLGRFASIDILYDGECPFCSRYARYQSISQAANSVRLISLRELPDELQQRVNAHGLNPNKGIIVFTTGLDGVVTGYGGRHSMTFLASFDQHSGWRGGLHRFMQKPWIARVTYPLLTTGRRALLILMGRNSRISSSSSNH